MEVILSSPRGFCAGVVRAIEVVEICLTRYGPPVYVKHQIVHNPHVVADLERKGAITVETIDAPAASPRSRRVTARLFIELSVSECSSPSTRRRTASTSL